MFVAGIMNRTITTGGPEAIPGTWKNISEVDVEGDLSTNQVPGEKHIAGNVFSPPTLYYGVLSV